MTTTTTGAFPYRFVATSGMYEGTTFIYRGDGSVISYETDNPAYYHLAARAPAGSPVRPGLWWPVSRHEMTAEKLAAFEAIPLKS